MENNSLLIKHKLQRSVTLSINIGVLKSEVWDVISEPSHLEKFHPYCKKNDIIKWPGIGSKDRLTYLNMKDYIRDFIEWDEKNGFSLMIGQINSPKSYVRWELNEKNKNTIVKISIYPNLLTKWPKIISYLPYKFYIEPKLKVYLKAVLEGLKHYVLSGKKIKRKDVPYHSWFC